MAKSRSESPLRQAEGNKTMPGPGIGNTHVVRGFSPVQEYKDSTTLKGCTTEMGQPEMRQA